MILVNGELIRFYYASWFLYSCSSWQTL